MISMGKSGGVYGSGNTGLPQAFSGGKKTQNNQKSIFGAKNKSSVTVIRRMLSRNSQSTQTQAANSWGQDSIVTSSLSYSESLRNQRQQTKNTTLALKKLKYQFKNISSKILRSKTSQAAKQAAGQARREVLRLKRQKQNSDSDSEEIDAAIAHAQAMERVAKKKAKHLEEEEMAKAADGIWQGDRISEEETKDVPDAEAENARNAEEMSAEDSANEVSGDFSAYEYAGDSYDISDYVDLGMDEFYAQAGDFMSEMSDFTSEMMQEMSCLWSEQGISQQTLAERTAKDKACLTSLMTNLERKGYVCRHEDPKDRRNKLVYLTDKGEAFHQWIAPTLAAYYKRLEDILGIDKLQQTEELLKELQYAIEGY